MSSPEEHAISGVELARRLARRLDGVTDGTQRGVLVREFCAHNSPSEVVQSFAALVQEAMRGNLRGAWVAVSIALIADDFPYELLGSLYGAARAAQSDAMRLLFVGGSVSFKVAKDGEFGRDDLFENVTLGQRKSAARGMDRPLLNRLLFDPEPSVVRILLGNPRVTEQHVMRLATRRPNRASTIREIARDFKWIRRSALQRALVLNPYTPVRVAVCLMPLLAPWEQHELAEDQNVHHLVRLGAKTFLELRSWQPPVFH